MNASRRRLALSLAAALASCLASTSARAGAAPQPIARHEIRQNLFSACFSSDTDGWVVGELGRVYHTTDGGNTFAIADTGTRNAFLAVACLPDGSVVVTGPKGAAMKTSDGGTTWQTLQTGAKRALLSVAFPTKDVGVAVGDFGTIIRTEDGGKTWTTIALPTDAALPQLEEQGIDPGDILLYDIAFPTPERGFAVGEFGAVFTTADGGKTWTAQKSPVENTLFGVYFADEKNGWATGIEESLIHTTDGGQTWKKLQVPPRKGFVLGIYDVAVKGNVGWAIGESGTLLRTTDGGNTWERVALPIRLAANSFRGIAVSGRANGIIVGSEGEILLTTGDQFHELKGS
ncbi:MAG TPA: YCF48-related protein [Candidatus Binatia bacterium]|nr:YCF48-related protein [Candidatus Binatia bacterium]